MGDRIASQIESFLNQMIPYVWIAVAFAIVGVGLACIIGTDRSRMAVKEKAPYIIVGCILVLGAVHIGHYFAELFSFTGV